HRRRFNARQQPHGNRKSRFSSRSGADQSLDASFQAQAIEHAYRGERSHRQAGVEIDDEEIPSGPSKVVDIRAKHAAVAEEFLLRSLSFGKVEAAETLLSEQRLKRQVLQNGAR